MKIIKTAANFEPEPFIQPFGFKGSYMQKSLQSVTMLQTDSGYSSIGLGTFNPLWADPVIFSNLLEDKSNALMFELLQNGLEQAINQEFNSPIEMLDALWPKVWEYGQKRTGYKNLSKSFVLNALVALDNAAWLLYAQEKNITLFDDLLPQSYRPALSHQHSKITVIPLISYNTPLSEIKQTVENGHYILKIKAGSPGPPEQMLEQDKKRLLQIHETVGHFQTPHTLNNKILYYLDANVRYPNKEMILSLLDYSQKIGAFDQIFMLEEPFPLEYETDVRDLGVPITADESIHTDKEAKQRIDMGYHIFALKPIAKTLSMTLKTAGTAHEAKVPCFCADLTVNPILVDWNKNIAARLAPMPGLSTGLLETNGHQNYKNWHQMTSYHPYNNAPWTKIEHGFFITDNDFYRHSGGIFSLSEHYSNMVS